MAMKRKPKPSTKGKNGANQKQKNKTFEAFSTTLDQNINYEMVIEDLTDDGDGIGHIEGLTVFVHNALPGDHILCKLIKIKKNYAIGIIHQMLERSPDHMTAPCPYARLCGGCQLQEYQYEAQIAFKAKMLRETLKRIGGLEDYTDDGFIGMLSPEAYRNKGIYQLEPHKEGPAMGFYRKRSHDLVDVDQCMLQTHSTNTLMKQVREWIKASGIPIYSEVTREGILRRVMVRDNHPKEQADKAMMLVFVVTKKGPEVDRLMQVILQSLPPNLKSIYLNINPTVGNTALSYDYEHIYGDEVIVDYIGEAQFKISPQSFFQINPIQTEKLYDVVATYTKEIIGSEVKEDFTILDLYCGIGSIGIYLAKQLETIHRIVGVEIVEGAILDARENAAFNGLNNTAYYVGKAEAVMPSLKADGTTADLVILDPPRKGCDETLLATLVDMAVANIIYVSCKPSTLARDLKYLCNNGYEVRRVTGVDMFPWTGHVETVCLLTRK